MIIIITIIHVESLIIAYISLLAVEQISYTIIIFDVDVISPKAAVHIVFITRTLVLLDGVWKHQICTWVYSWTAPLCLLSSARTRHSFIFPKSNIFFPPETGVSGPLFVTRKVFPTPANDFSKNDINGIDVTVFNHTRLFGK